MCWVTYSGKKPRVHTATSDIKVVKFLLHTSGDDFIAPYKGTKYDYGKAVKADEPMNLRVHFGANDSWSITHGLHSYSPKCRMRIKDGTIMILPKDRCEAFKKYGYFELDHWDYTYDNPNASFWDEEEFPVCIMLGYIPKGTRYYVNDVGEYVSDKLVITALLDYASDVVEIDNNECRVVTFKKYYSL